MLCLDRKSPHTGSWTRLLVFGWMLLLANLVGCGDNAPGTKEASSQNTRPSNSASAKPNASQTKPNSSGRDPQASGDSQGNGESAPQVKLPSQGGTLTLPGMSEPTQVEDPKADPLPTWELASMWEMAEPLKQVRFTAQGDHLAVGSRKAVVFYDTTDWQPAKPISLEQKGDIQDGPLITFALSPNGKGLAVVAVGTATNATILYWPDWSQPEQVKKLSGHSDLVTAIRFVPSSQPLLISGSNDRTLKVWNTQTGQALLTVPNVRQTVAELAVSPSGEQLATGSASGNVLLWRFSMADGPKLQPFQVIQAHTSSVSLLSYTPNGRFLVSSGYEKTTAPLPPTATIWVAANGRRLTRVQGQSRVLTSVSFSPDGRLIALGSGDGSVRICEMTTERAPPTVAWIRQHTDYVNGVAFSPDGQLLASVGDDKTVRLWSVPPQWQPNNPSQ